MGRFLRYVLLYVANLNQFRSAIELLTFILFANFIIFVYRHLTDSFTGPCIYSCVGVFLGSEGKIVGYPLLQSGPESITIRTSLLRRGLFVLLGGWGKRKRERAENDEKGK